HTYGRTDGVEAVARLAGERRILFAFGQSPSHKRGGNVDLGLRGQTAVIAGGARGIGRAIACAFAAEGANIAVLDRDPETPVVARELERVGVRALALVADVTDFEAIRSSAAQVEQTFGRIHHVVFAVGIGSGKFGFPFWHLEPADWPRVLQVNVVGAANVAHAFAPTLVQARSGTMLFLASVAGQIGSQTDPPYSASKAALINFAQCAAKDLAPYGVRVNTLCPGMVKTALNRSIWEAWARLQPEGQRQSYEEWAAEKIRRLVPLNRWQEPEDVAAMAVFLASERARNVTGQTINVDGGFVMHS
ncbi:MAG: SDR family oxidoreductase, partial [Gemmataceae bacterium]|nr:SDR family oxidoreductase [Gemmataceae bacterium]